MRRIKRSLLVITALTVAYSLALALDVPYLSGRINDTANMLSSGVVVELEEMLKAYEDSTTNQIVLLTIPSLEGESLEDYSLRVAETWKLGQKGVDNGVLLLIARDDRKLRIEVGYGLEASVTDAISTMIINGIITPRFKQGDFEGGIREGLIALTKAADGTLSEAELATSSDEEFPLIFFLLFWYGIVGVFTFIALFSPGCSGWGLYAFLIPFHGAPGLILAEETGWPIGYVFFALYLLGFPIFKIILARTAFGKKMATKMATSSRGGSWSSGGWTFSSGGGGGGWSSGGSSFSGGGGSFGGGGSSGSW